MGQHARSRGESHGPLGVASLFRFTKRSGEESPSYDWHRSPRYLVHANAPPGGHHDDGNDFPYSDHLREPYGRPGHCPGSAATAGNAAASGATTADAASIPKAVIHVGDKPPRHWVGDGFPVHGMFDYGQGADQRSPFLLMDYAAPTSFTPNSGYRRGVGGHPHRGFETVTIVYDGEVEHRDSTGAGGVIGAGDVQWMTAGGGIIHEEFQSDAYSRRGGPFEMVQLWVNLPARDKMTPAHYQSITAAQIPEVPAGQRAAGQGGEADGAAGRTGTVRVIAGEFDGNRGPAETYTPMNVWDVRLSAGAEAKLPQPAGWSTLLLVQSGTVRVNGHAVGEGQLVTLSREGSGLTLEALEGDARVLLLAGEPIDEPVVGHGPFVMNSRDEIRQAIADFNSGRFGNMPR